MYNFHPGALRVSARSVYDVPVPAELRSSYGLPPLPVTNTAPPRSIDIRPESRFAPGTSAQSIDDFLNFRRIPNTIRALPGGVWELSF